MNRSLLLSLLLTAVLHPCFGQLTSHWQNEAFMHHTLNPAILGQYDQLRGSVQYGRRWDRLSSSPSEVHAIVSLPFRNDHMSLGLSLSHTENGPLVSSGLGIQYAYSFPLGLGRSDKLSLGVSARIQSMRLDPSSLVAADQGDLLITDMDNRISVPPGINIGFNYVSATPSYQEPIAVQFGAAYARFIPFSDRFNTSVYSQPHQWYLQAGIHAYLAEETSILGKILVSDIGAGQIRTAVRTTVDHTRYGWLALQYNTFNQLMTQAAVRIRVNDAFGDQLRLIGSYVWNFGALGSDLGNGLSIGIGYHRQLSD